MRAPAALEVALTLAGRPALVRSASRMPLPSGVTFLLELATGADRRAPAQRRVDDRDDGEDDQHGGDVHHRPDLRELSSFRPAMPFPGGSAAAAWLPPGTPFFALAESTADRSALDGASGLDVAAAPRRPTSPA